MSQGIVASFLDIFHWLISFLDKPIFYAQGMPITPLGIILGMFIIVLSFFFSKIVQRLLGKRILKKTHLDRGAIFAITRIAHYVIITVAVFFALGLMGIDIKSLVVVFGFLGVGIGFGLQNITSNFISGLILLFERPIKIGDRITVGDQNGDVVDINMRATKIVTRDNIAIIVPNSSLISDNVINWSIGDPKIRIHVKANVSYLSDVKKVTQILLDVAGQNEKVLEVPAPKVWFRSFGESALEFELLVWVCIAGDRQRVISDLNYLIREAFIENNIEIPFPQRVVHLQERKVE